MSHETNANDRKRAASEMTDRFVRGSASEDEYIDAQQKDLEEELHRARERVRQAGRNTTLTIEEALRIRQRSPGD